MLAEYFRVAVDELGFRRPRPTASELHQRASTSPGDLLTLVAAPGQQDPRVEKDQQQWRELRQAFGERRRELAVLAEQLYPDYQVPGPEHTGVITHPSWIPDEPIPLGQVVLDRLDNAPGPTVTGAERETAPVRPLASTEQRYRRYSHAVRDLASPKLFENRLCFRLLDVDWSRPAVQLSFGAMGFFDSIDSNEAVAHETAPWCPRPGRPGLPLAPLPTGHRARLQKGDGVVLTGSLVTRTWTADNGSKRHKLDVAIDELGASLLFRDVQIEQ